MPPKGSSGRDVVGVLIHRAEKLLIVGRIFLGHVDQHRGLVEEAHSICTLAAGQEPGPVLQRVFDLPGKAVKGLSGRKRAEQSVLTHGITHRHASHATDECVNESIGDAALNDEPLGAGADLPSIDQSPNDRGLDGLCNVCIVKHHEDVAPNADLVQLTAQDQAVRSGAMKDIDWAKLSIEDAARRTKVLEMIRHGTIRTSEDYCNAALIFQHGETADDIRLAYSLATIARALDNESRRCGWLSAAAWDRILMRMKRPQWYGTQFVKLPSGKWGLYDIDETAVTDADRAELGVPPLSAARARAEKLQ